MHGIVYDMAGRVAGCDYDYFDFRQLSPRGLSGLHRHADWRAVGG